MDDKRPGSIASVDAAWPTAGVGDQAPGRLGAPARQGGYVGIVDCVLHAIRCRPRLESLVIAESAVR